MIALRFRSVIGRVEHFYPDDGMDLPGGGPPWVMIFVRPDGLDGVADVSRAVMVVIPEEVAGDTDLARGVPGWLHESGQGRE